MEARCVVIPLVFVGLLAASAAIAVSREGNVVTMTDAESAKCGADCMLISKEGVEAEIEKRAEQRLRQALVSNLRCRDIL